MVRAKLLGQKLLKTLECCGVRVDALYLFGSRARGDASTQSDMDVLLVSPMFSKMSFYDRCAFLGEAIGDFSEPLQIYPVTPREYLHPDEGGFIESIADELRPLYVRRSLKRPRTAAKRQRNGSAIS